MFLPQNVLTKGTLFSEIEIVVFILKPTKYLSEQRWRYFLQEDCKLNFTSGSFSNYTILITAKEKLDIRMDQFGLYMPYPLQLLTRGSRNLNRSGNYI